MRGVQFGKIIAKKDDLRREISREEIRRMLEEGWYVGVEFCVKGKSGWIVINKEKMDVLALDKDVMNFLKKHEEVILRRLGVF